MSSFSASATRAFQPSSLREQRPASMTGFFAPREQPRRGRDELGRRAHRAAARRSARRPAARGSAPSFSSCIATSRLTYTGPARRRLRDLRGAQQRLDRRADRSGLVVPLGEVADERRPGRTLVWIQSIHGRRFVASHGPVAPMMSIGARSHHALKIAIGACMSPTFACSAAAIIAAGRLGVAVRDRRPRSPRGGDSTICGVAVAEVVDDAVVQPAVARAGNERDVAGSSSSRSIAATASLPQKSSLSRERTRRIVNDVRQKSWVWLPLLSSLGVKA